MRYGDSQKTLSDEQIADYYLISPEEAYKGARWQEERWLTSPSVEWCNKALRENVSGVLAGETCGIVAYSGDGKTSLALAQAYYTSKQLILAKKALTHRVLFYTWDQAAEFLEIKLEHMIRHDRAARKGVDVSKVPNLTLAERIALPLWFAGKSAKKHRETDFIIPELTVERIGDVLDIIVKEGQVEIALLIGDYAQRVKSSRKSNNRYENITLVAELFQDFVSTRNVPGILTIQAGTETKKRQNKVPRIEDVQGTTDLAKILDMGFGQWIPSNSERLGTPVRYGHDGKITMVERGLVIANNFKDRRKETNVEFIYPFDLSTLQIGDYQ